MNLENLNLVELNAQEVQETEGGFLPLLIIGAALLLTGCASAKAPCGVPPVQGK
ncbi:class IIb bacteriocin, lactobin A/cerein 7B family [Flavobacterium sp.]|uniref:class IIb bacteriocin, lactobin A/cerein 7B family n=1 Tax=Flavobacterium sp. TaxID=239 RepID=UPI004048D828